MLNRHDKLRITFVCPCDSLTGGMRVIAIYAEQLARRGHEVTCVIPQPPPPPLIDRARVLLKRGRWLKPHVPNDSFFTHKTFAVRRLSHAGPIAARDVPDGDVVIATWWQTAEWVWALPAAKGAKLHFMQDYETWAAPGGNVARVDAACALPMPKIIIARWVQELLAERWNQTPVALVPNSVDTSLFFAAPRTKQPTPTIGLTYSPMPSKGTDVSVAAFEEARRELGGNLRLISFGSARPWAGSPLPDDAEFHFQAPDHSLRDLYARCDAWLFGTRREGFGLPILEAMACRTPVIGTPAGAAPDLLTQGGGMLVPMEDSHAMARAVVDIARMPEEQWQGLSAAAHRTATAFTWNDAGDMFEAAVIGVAQQRTSVPLDIGGARPTNPSAGVGAPTSG